jgi:hypothetical protein
MMELTEIKNLIDEVRMHAKATRLRYPDVREGQAIFNALYSLEPEIANAMRGGELDPFYADSMIEPFLFNAIALLRKKREETDIKSNVD